MTAPYDYASATGYPPARPIGHWLDYPDTTYGTVGSLEFGRWDQALADLKATIFNVKDFGAVGNGVTNDTTAIQNAINVCAAAGGGTVFLPVGTYMVTRLQLKSYVTLRGAGVQATTIKKLSGNLNIVELSSARQEQVGVRDLTIDGNFVGTTGHGIYVLNDSATNGSFASGFLNARHSLRNLVIKNVVEDGVNLAGDAFGGEWEIANVAVYFAGIHGFLVACPDLVFTGCESGQSGKEGFRDTSGNNRYVGCKAWYAGRTDVTAGSGFRTTSFCTLVGCFAQDNKQNGFSFFGAQNVIGVGLIADSNGTGATANGVDIQNASGCTISVSAWDRQTVKTQQFALNSTGSTKCVFDITSGAQATGAFPAAQLATDNIVRVQALGAPSRTQFGASFGISGDGYAELTEITAPSAGAGNTARFFSRDNGSGKTQLCVIFSTGAIQVIATQP